MCWKYLFFRWMAPRASQSPWTPNVKITIFTAKIQQKGYSEADYTCICKYSIQCPFSTSNRLLLATLLYIQTQPSFHHRPVQFHDCTLRGCMAVTESVLVLNTSESNEMRLCGRSCKCLQGCVLSRWLTQTHRVKTIPARLSQLVIILPVGTGHFKSG